jgi:3-hydroxyisobutyrate dehydrogenase-like beta-hydroxyacid dehydrogenase
MMTDRPVILKPEVPPVNSGTLRRNLAGTVADGLPLAACRPVSAGHPGAAAGVVVLAVGAADHQIDAKAELLVHVAATAEQHGEPEQRVRGVA